jgi:hypothetical protein
VPVTNVFDGRSQLTVYFRGADDHARLLIDALNAQAFASLNASPGARARLRRIPGR